MIRQLGKVVGAILAFFGCLSIACMFGAALSGMSPLTTLSFFALGVVLLTPIAFSSPSLALNRKLGSIAPINRLDAYSWALTTLGVLLWMTPYLICRSPAAVTRGDTTLWILGLGMLLLGGGYVLRYLAARRARLGPAERTGSMPPLNDRGHR